jgi:hypothetical protein
MFNKSWKDGSTPLSWNKAIIIPLLKPNKDKNDPASYRLISLTSTFTKLMQKMIKPRLCNYLEYNNLISPAQSGCRSHHSCDDNLARLEADASRAINSNKFLLAVFLDLSNAFDKSWIGAAIGSLGKIGIRGRMLKWIKEFLATRSIKVKLNGSFSEVVETVNGCPQGSVLSPIIFSLIMNIFSETIAKFNNNKSLVNMAIPRRMCLLIGRMYM